MVGSVQAVNTEWSEVCGVVGGVWSGRVSGRLGENQVFIVGVV